MLVSQLSDMLPCPVGEVGSRLEGGSTLPSALYTDPAIDGLEDRLIWRSAWQEVGVRADFRKAGDFLTARLGRYPVIVLRDNEGALRAFLNVCRHRGTLVLGGELGDEPDNLCGNRRALTCKYHGWTYGLDGALRGAPDAREGRFGDPAGLGLIPVSVAEWGGIVFVSIEPKMTLAEHMSGVAPIAERFGYRYPFLNEELELAGVYEWQVQANWKAFMDINLECYHCRTTHQNSLAAILNVDMAGFLSTSFPRGTHLRAPFADDLDRRIEPEAARRLQELATSSGEGAFQQFWVWPTNMWTTGVGFGNSLFRIDRTGPTTCRMVARVYLNKDDTTERARLDDFVKNVIAEDVGAANGTQIGLESGARAFGPLHAVREEGLSWFAAQVWDHLRPAFDPAATP